MISHVDASLYRGPRPLPSEYGEIQQSFSSVLSLEGMAEDEKEMAELYPVPVSSCPIVFLEIYWRGITQQRLSNILDQIEAAPKPLLVHCQHGQDRTGLIIACYRVRVNKWPKATAMAEALQYGYRHWLNFGLNKTWRAFEG